MTHLQERPLAFRPKDAPKVLGVSRSTIYSLLSQGKLRSTKIAGCRVITMADAEALLREAV